MRRTEDTVTVVWLHFEPEDELVTLEVPGARELFHPTAIEWIRGNALVKAHGTLTRYERVPLANLPRDIREQLTGDSDRCTAVNAETGERCAHHAHEPDTKHWNGHVSTWWP